jgi:hypothetical protein
MDIQKSRYFYFTIKSRYYQLNNPIPQTHIMEAIDRMASGKKDGVPGLLKYLFDPYIVKHYLMEDLLCKWKEEDILIATGKSRNFWIDYLNEHY